VNGVWLRAAGAGRQCAPAALGMRFWAAPQLHPLGATLALPSHPGSSQFPQPSSPTTLQLVHRHAPILPELRVTRVPFLETTYF